MEPYPLSVRKRIIEKYQSGLDTQDIAEDYGYCLAGMRRVWQRFRETGSMVPRPRNSGRKPRFDAAALEQLRLEVGRSRCARRLARSHAGECAGGEAGFYR